MNPGSETSAYINICVCPPLNDAWKGLAAAHASCSVSKCKWMLVSVSEC